MESEMTIRVVYHNNTCDTIPVSILQLGIECGKIKMFYRNSERTWITVGADSMIRTANRLAPYAGPERRATEILESLLLLSSKRD